MARQNPQADFDQNAQKIAEQFVLDAQDIKRAYAGKPDSLSAHFNAMSEARDGRNRNIGWGIFWLIVVPPVAIYNAFRVYNTVQTLNSVKAAITEEVTKMKALPAPQEQLALPPAPPQPAPQPPIVP